MLRKTQYDPNAREICLSLARICQYTGSWEGYRKLHRVAEYLYSRWSIPEPLPSTTTEANRKRSARGTTVTTSL